LHSFPTRLSSDLNILRVTNPKRHNIRNNVMVGNLDDNQRAVCDTAITLTDDKPSKRPHKYGAIEYNTIAKCYAGISVNDKANTLVVNNIVTRAAVGYTGTAQRAQFLNNVSYKVAQHFAGESRSYQHSQMYTDSPKFVDALNDDYHLRKGSPYKNAARYKR